MVYSTENKVAANKIGKVIFRLLKKNFPSLSSLYKIFDWNMVKLSYRSKPKVATVID